MTTSAAAHAAQMQQAQEQMQKLLAKSATDLEFRAQLLSDPRGALASYTGQPVPASYDIRFVESQGDATIVLPPVIVGSSELSDAELEAVAGGSTVVILTIGPYMPYLPVMTEPTNT